MTKRLIDLVIAFFLIVFFSPILILISFLIKINLGGRIFFTQVRPGKNEKKFEMIKFKTMLDRYDEQGELLPDKERMTKLGGLLRSTSLDELPELLNVLKGDMSLVGPRPLLVEYLDIYTPEQARRHDVRPGITGWAQVNGRNKISWEEKFRLDTWYVDNQSLSLDLKIMWLTIWKVFKREGISASNHVTTEKFKGTRRK